MPAYPPDPSRLERSLPRLEAIIRDAEPKVVLTLDVLTELLGGDVLATDTLPAGSWFAPGAPDDVALLQYTSGSTAAPRGVMLTHANLLHNSDFIRRAFGNTERSCGVIWLPPYHDMGLIGGILQPVFVGFPCHLMSPFTMLQRPVNWLRAISEHGGTVSGGPNFAFELCLRRVGEADRAELDLSSWEIAFNGSEPVRAETIDAFAEMFAPCGFRREAFFPCYGLAEGTLMVTGGERLAGPRVRRHGDKELVGCGRPDPEHEVVIADPAGEPLPDGQEGEICVSGPSVAAGYWRAGAFGPRLRTGDLGLFADGELYVTGRIKELVIVAGRNHHAVDIEMSCERAVPALRRGCGAAFSYDGTGREHDRDRLRGPGRSRAGRRRGHPLDARGGHERDRREPRRRRADSAAQHSQDVERQGAARRLPHALPRGHAAGRRAVAARLALVDAQLERPRGRGARRCAPTSPPRA